MSSGTSKQKLVGLKPSISNCSILAILTCGESEDAEPCRVLLPKKHSSSTEESHNATYFLMHFLFKSVDTGNACGDLVFLPYPNILSPQRNPRLCLLRRVISYCICCKVSNVKPNPTPPSNPLGHSFSGLTTRHRGHRTYFASMMQHRWASQEKHVQGR